MVCYAGVGVEGQRGEVDHVRETENTNMPPFEVEGEEGVRLVLEARMLPNSTFAIPC